MVHRNAGPNRHRQFCKRERSQSEAAPHGREYLCELVYELALTPGDNVSQSPGFETPLGMFGGPDN